MKQLSGCLEIVENTNPHGLSSQKEVGSQFSLNELRSWAEAAILIGLQWAPRRGCDIMGDSSENDEKKNQSKNTH